MSIFFFQAEDGIRDLVRSRGLGDVYKRQHPDIRTATTVQLATRAALDLTVRVDVGKRWQVSFLSLIHI